MMMPFFARNSHIFDSRFSLLHFAFISSRLHAAAISRHAFTPRFDASFALLALTLSPVFDGCR
jgi:hypothetical protein